MEENSKKNVNIEFLKFMNLEVYNVTRIDVECGKDHSLLISKLKDEGYEIFPHIMGSSNNCEIVCRKLK
jgi:hypothetical protein